MTVIALVAALLSLSNAEPSIQNGAITGGLKAMREKELSRMTSYETTTFGLDNFDSQQQLEFTFGDESYLVQLFPKEHLTPNRIKHTNGHLDASSRWFTALDTPCHYSGHIVEPAHLSNMSAVALSLCPNRGVRGSILLGNDRLFINPAAYFLGSTHSHELGDEHIVYRASDFDSTGLPGASLSVQPQTVTETSNSRRSLIENNLNVDLSLELYVAVDPSVTESYQAEYGDDWYQELAAWAVDVVNSGSVAFEQFDDYSTTMGSIGVRIAELEVMADWTGDYRNLRPSDYAQKTEMDSSAYLNALSEWVTDTGRDTFDTHHLFTFYKFAEGTSGIAYGSCICKSWCAGLTSTTYSDNWNVRTFAHELGHNFGAKHDGTARGVTNNDCDEEAGIMGYGSNPNDWSDCTVGYFEDYYSKSGGLTCMKNGFQDTVFTNYDGDDLVITPSPISGGGVDCISVSGHSAANNGEYAVSGTSNGWVAYNRGDWWIYSIEYTEDGVTADWWVTSTSKGSEEWDYGWCGPNLNILQCNGDAWEDSNGGGEFASISSCGSTPITPAPTPRVTPSPTTPSPVTSPVDSPSTNCITVSGHSAASNGQYATSGTNNGEVAYTRNGWYIYSISATEDGVTADWWVTGTSQGSEDWDAGWCGPNLSILQCSGNWEEYQNGGAFSSISSSSCGGSTVPSPTPRVTPSPVVSSSQSCVSIKKLSSTYNGGWTSTGEYLNGQMVYTDGGNYLFYTYEASSSSYFWTFDTQTFATDNGDYGWSNGWCDASDITSCSSNWAFNSGSTDNNCVFSETCNAFEEDAELDCVTNNEYEVNVCIESSHNASLWSGLVQFSVSLEECAAELPMFTATVDGVEYFLYANVYREFVDSETTSTQWVISRDHLRATAQLAYCEEADLADCSAGNWNVYERSVDYIVTVVDAEMAFLDRECVVSEDSANSNASDDSTSTVTWIAVALVVALVLLVVAVVVIVRNKHSKVVVGFEDKEEIELDMSVEKDPEDIEIIATTTHTTTTVE